MKITMKESPPPASAASPGPRLPGAGGARAGRERGEGLGERGEERGTAHLPTSGQPACHARAFSRRGRHQDAALCWTFRAQLIAVPAPGYVWFISPFYHFSYTSKRKREL